MSDMVKTFLVFPYCLLTRYIILSYSEVFYITVEMWWTLWLVMSTLVVSEIQGEIANITVAQIKLNVSYKGMLDITTFFSEFSFTHCLSA